MTCIAQSQVIYYPWRIALFGQKYHKLEWFTYRTVSSRGGEPLRKWLKMRFRQNIFLSLLYTIYKFRGSVPKPSPRGQILETALFTWLTLANVIIAFISYKNLSKAENPVVDLSWKKRRQIKTWKLKIKKIMSVSMVLVWLAESKSGLKFAFTLFLYSTDQHNVWACCVSLPLLNQSVILVQTITHHQSRSLRRSRWYLRYCPTANIQLDIACHVLIFD